MTKDEEEILRLGQRLYDAANGVIRRMDANVPGWRTRDSHFGLDDLLEAMGAYWSRGLTIQNLLRKGEATTKESDAMHEAFTTRHGLTPEAWLQRRKAWIDRAIANKVRYWATQAVKDFDAPMRKAFEAKHGRTPEEWLTGEYLEGPICGGEAFEAKHGKAAEVDVPAERAAFEAKHGMTPDAWMAKWRAGKFLENGENTRTSFDAALLEDASALELPTCDGEEMMPVEETKP